MGILRQLMSELFLHEFQFALSFFASALCAQALSAEKTYVGVLDDAREEMVNWKPGVAHKASEGQSSEGLR
jgi:hypothetical protein